MHRFFVNSSDIKEDIIIIRDSDANHISNVLRLNTGDEIEVCDGNSTDYICSIESISKSLISLKILSSYKCKSEPDINITLYQGLPKADKMEYIIQKCVELGVKTFVPVMNKRSVIKLKDTDKKISRWQKISDEACKQSKRGIIPNVLTPLTFKDAIDSLKDDSLNILAYEKEENTSLKDILLSSDCKNINIFIGPEGGFDDDEINYIKDKNIKNITLGPRILRTETAPIALVSAIMYEIGDW